MCCCWLLLLCDACHSLGVGACCLLCFASLLFVGCCLLSVAPRSLPVVCRCASSVVCCRACFDVSCLSVYLLCGGGGVVRCLLDVVRLRVVFVVFFFAFHASRFLVIVYVFLVSCVLLLALVLFRVC